MLIKVSMTVDGHLAPQALATVSSLPEAYCFHEHHGKRHPVSIYSGSLRAITKQWKKTADAIDKLTAEHNWANTETSYGQVLDDYRELLYRLNEHHDACLAILRSLCPPYLAVKPTKLDHQFLLNAKLLGAKQFLDQTKEYRENHIGILVNTLKHKQGELFSIFFHSSLEFRPGYYLRDILPGGALGPSEKLHSGGRTAFSFSRDLMMHLWWLYRFGELLSTAIQTAVESLYGQTLVVAMHSFDDDNLLLTIRACAALKPMFFPDECKKVYPRILLTKDEQKMTLEFPTRAPGNEPKNMRISTAFTVDKLHLTNKAPYFGQDYEKWFRKQ